MTAEDAINELKAGDAAKRRKGARAALPALGVLQKDEDEDVRQTAARAVKRIQTRGP
jgi:hypothetical protein